MITRALSGEIDIAGWAVTVKIKNVVAVGSQRFGHDGTVTHVRVAFETKQAGGFVLHRDFQFFQRGLRFGCGKVLAIDFPEQVIFASAGCFATGLRVPSAFK